MLLHAKDPETQESAGNKQLRDEVLIMFVAGQEDHRQYSGLVLV